MPRRPIPALAHLTRAAAVAAVGLATCATGAAAAATGPTVAVKVTGSRAPYFVLHARPGQTRAGSLTVTDVSRRGGGVSLYATDATTGQTSGAVYLSPQQPRRGVGAWVTLSRRRLVLAPGQSVRVSFRLAVPADAGPGEHLGGIVVAPDAPQTVTHGHRGRAAFGVRVREQSVIAVQADLPGPQTRHLAVTGVGMGAEGPDQAVDLVLASDGDLLTKGSGTLTLSDAHGRLRLHRRFALDTFVPHTQISFPVAVEGRALTPGRYRARVTLAWSGGRTTQTFGLRVTPRDVAQRYGSGPGTTVARAGTKASDLPWILVAALAGLLMLGLAYAAGTRTRRGSAQA